MFALRCKLDTRKICLLGDFAVGKTSLVDRFVNNQFSERYLTTIGVKVDTKAMSRPNRPPIKLAIWDMAGTNTPTGLFLRYLRGASGYLLVADGTRCETLDRALELRSAVDSHIGVLPCVGLVNKLDQRDLQEIDDERLERLRADGDTWLRTSARMGDNVEQAFAQLLASMAGNE